MPNTSLSISLRAENSSGEQILHLDVQDINGKNEFHFCLTGKYEGKPIQIDFDVMTEQDLIDLKTMIELILMEK